MCSPSAPTQQQMATTELPEWARPYAQKALAKTEALTETPLTKYTEPRIAGFSPLQQAAMSTVESPETYGRSIGAFMSPYMQNVVDVQKREAARQSAMMGTQQQAQATGAGAFGGYREALQRAERERNLGQQMNDIQTRGSEAAYQGAQGTLGNFLGLQSQYGAQQQALRQQGLSQAYQDFMNEQNYPYKQLGFMSDMIRGLPLGQQGTRQLYEAAPTGLQQLGQLGFGAYGLKQLGMFADGGEVKTYAGDKGSVTSREFVEAALDKMSDTQLAQAERTAVMRNDTERLGDIAEEKAMRASERGGLMGAYDIARAARGGVVAFAEDGLVEGPKTVAEALTSLYGRKYGEDLTPEERAEKVREQKTGLSSLYAQPKTIPMLEKLIGEQQTQVADTERLGKGATALQIARALGETGISSSTRLGRAFGAAGEGALQAEKLKRDAQNNLNKSQMLMAQAQDAYDVGLTDKAVGLVQKAQDRKDKAVDLNIAADKAAVTALGPKEIEESRAKTAEADRLSREKIAREQIQQRAAEMDKPGESERMIAKGEAILSGKSDFNGKTGLEGFEAYRSHIEQTMAAKLGTRYTGPDKATENQLKLDRLVQQDPRFEAAVMSKQIAGNKTDAKSVAARAKADEDLRALRREYEERYPALASAGKGGTGKPITKEAYDKLPSGATFMAPDGSMRIKP